MSKVISIILVLILMFLLVSCAAEAQTVPSASADVSSSAAATALPGTSADPGATPAPTPVPTTEPEPSPTAAPESEPEPVASQSTVPAGIVKDSGEIIGTDVAFREAPDVESAVITRLDRGTYVQIIKTNVDAQWHQVKYDGKTGYVNRMYICLDSSLDGYKLDFVGTIINCKNDVNVRKEPTTESEIIGVANKGSDLTVLPQDTHIPDWYQVEFEGQTAYIHADYLDVAAKVDDTQLADLTVTGGKLYPSFSPNEYGYVIKATASEVTIDAKANDGVRVDINETGESRLTIAIPSAGMKTVRIALDGEIRYSIYISRNVITVGTWNIKRGDGNLLMQGRLVYDQQPDIMGIQEAFQDLTASDIVDNLASLKTRDMSHNTLAATINYSNGSQYGNGLISRYKLQDLETYVLDSGSYEKRVLQKAVVYINDKAVSVYNTHLTYNTESVRAKQFAQILEIMNDDPNKYKILTGDFNAHISEFSVFKDYTVINTKETKYYDYSKNLIDINEIDNVVVSSNIDVINSRIVVTRYSDHCPVFAYLVLN